LIDWRLGNFIVIQQIESLSTKKTGAKNLIFVDNLWKNINLEDYFVEN